LLFVCLLFVGCFVASEQLTVENSETFFKYELTLNWKDKRTEKYDFYLSKVLPETKDIYGIWVNSSGDNLAVVATKEDPLTFVLQLRITDTSWILEVTKFENRNAIGILYRENWGTTTKAGSFNISLAPST